MNAPFFSLFYSGAFIGEIPRRIFAHIDSYQEFLFMMIILPIQGGG